MKNLVELEKNYGAVNYKGKKYILTEQAYLTNRCIPYWGWENRTDGEEYEFEMACEAIEFETGTECTVYWIFKDVKSDDSKELDEFDYTENIDRVTIND